MQSNCGTFELFENSNKKFEIFDYSLFVRVPEDESVQILDYAPRIALVLQLNILGIATLGCGVS